jgi:hypothetical protein
LLFVVLCQSPLAIWSLGGYVPSVKSWSKVVTTISELFWLGGGGRRP